jgi:hypothetical protein
MNTVYAEEWTLALLLTPLMLVCCLSQIEKFIYLEGGDQYPMMVDFIETTPQMEDWVTAGGVLSRATE